MKILKALLFLWISSFLLAITVYYSLHFTIQPHKVFASWFRMYGYHSSHPIPFILIPCFFYGIVSTLVLKFYTNELLTRNLLLTIIIGFTTILISLPFGGMLYFYFDYKAGWFPENWIERMINDGFSAGFGLGWLIIAFSFPFNIIGLVVSFYLNKRAFTLMTKKM